jgi:hypothetical protein
MATSAKACPEDLCVCAVERDLASFCRRHAASLSGCTVSLSTRRHAVRKRTERIGGKRASVTMFRTITSPLDKNASTSTIARPFV